MKNQSEKNVYVQKILLNGKKRKNNYFLHSDLMNGAAIVFEMGAKAKKKASHTETKMLSGS